MIHHVLGDTHYAHSELLPCPRFACDGPVWVEGEDGRCDWCRESDARWEWLRETYGWPGA